MFALSAGFALCAMLNFADGAQNSSDSEIMEWEAPEYLKAKYPYYLSGYDYDGSPVFVLQLGKWDIVSAMKGGRETEADFDRWMAQMMFRWRSAGEQAVGSVGAVGIIDYDIFQVDKAGVVPLMLRQYPKFHKLAQLPSIKKIYIVNATPLLQMVYKFEQPMLEETDRIERHGRNSAGWKPVLLRAIPAKELPAWLGGSKNDEDMKVFG